MTRFSPPLNPLKLAYALVLSLLLAGCSSLPELNYDQKKVTHTLGAPDKWSEQSIDKNVAVNWLTSFNDPMLLALIAEGKANNIDLKTSAANVEKANLLSAKSATALQPVANLALSSNQSGALTGCSAPSSTNIGINVSWEADVWGRLEAGVASAHATAQSAQADYTYAVHSLSAAIAKGYFKVIESKQQSEVAAKNVQLLSQMMRITQVKYDNGIASGQDLAINRANLAAANEQLHNLQGSQRHALRALELLLGRYPNAESDVPSVLPKLPLAPPAGIPSDLLARRPDLVSAERKIAAAFNALKQAKTAQLPSFSLTSAINGTSRSLSDAINPANLAWQLAANITAPLFDAGRKKIDVKIANIEQQQAIANFAQKALGAFSEVENALDQGQVLALRYIALEQALLQSQKAYKIAYLRYKEGDIGLLDTLNIQQQAISAQSNLSSINRLALEQRINLYLAIGGSW